VHESTLKQPLFFHFTLRHRFNGHWNNR